MTVLVANRLDGRGRQLRLAGWAMDGGRVLSSGTAADCSRAPAPAQRKPSSLPCCPGEAPGHHPVHGAKLPPVDGQLRSRRIDLSKPLRGVPGVVRSTCAIERGENLRFPRLQRCGKTTTMKMLRVCCRLAPARASVPPAPGNAGDLHATRRPGFGTCRRRSRCISEPDGAAAERWCCMPWAPGAAVPGCRKAEDRRGVCLELQQSSAWRGASRAQLPRCLALGVRQRLSPGGGAGGNRPELGFDP